jgi:diguanylate cyclase (GGDEF)-like protein
MYADLTPESWAFLSTKPAGRRENRYAWIAVLVSAVFFVCAVPFARTPLAQFPAFIPIYVSWLVICDLITAALLFGQFSVLQSKALLIMAGGYLFTASITAVYAVIFPGLFAPPGLMGAGPQTTSAMYMFWHAGFPLFIMAYTRIQAKRAAPVLPLPGPEARHKTRAAILWTAGGVLTLVLAYSAFAIRGQAYIPEFLNGNRTTDLGHLFLLGVWAFSLLALVMLWRRKPHTVLDVWLMVVMCVWLFDIALAALLNTGRYDLGWYVGRIYGLLAASFLLIVLLIEDGKHYAQLVQLSGALSAANKQLVHLSRHDGLTELANRRFFDEYLSEQIAVAKRYNRALALVICDVDQFKAYNDHYGHQIGDACLRQVAAAIQSCCRRPADKAVRYGGEEFALILPDTDLAGATRIAEAVREAVSHQHIPHERSTIGSHVSTSCGVAMLMPHADMPAQQLIGAADACLYQAKKLGRNRVVCA